MHDISDNSLVSRLLLIAIDFDTYVIKLKRVIFARLTGHIYIASLMSLL